MVTLNAVSRIASAAGKLIFMDPKFTETAEKALAASHKAQGWKNIHRQMGDCFVKAEQATRNESFLGGLKKLITDIPKDLQSGWASKGAWGKFKGIGGAVLKRLPLLFVAMELPNIISAFKDEGLVGGICETLKSGTRMAASMAGFTIGQALIPLPVVGGLIGCFVTDFITSKILGKSHTEKKEEAQEALAKADSAEQQALALQQQLAFDPRLVNNNYSYSTNPYSQNMNFNIPQPTMTPQQLMAMQQMLCSGSQNAMDQDVMATMSGINRINYMC
jgi:hypothetical protein